MDKKNYMINQDILVNLPNDLVFIESEMVYKDVISINQIIYHALKIKLKMSLSNNLIYIVSESKNIFKISDFNVKVLTFNLIENPEFIQINLEDAICSPQIILLAGFDKELKAACFKGALSGDEFNILINNQLENIDKISIPIENFNGGFNKFNNILSAFESSEISNITFLKNLSGKKYTLGKVDANKFLDFIESNSNYSLKNALSDLNISLNNNIKEFRKSYLSKWKMLFKEYSSKNDESSKELLVKINRAVDLLDSLSDEDLIMEKVL